MTPARLSQSAWVLLLGVLGAAIALRFVGLDHLPGINGDEAVFPVHASEWRAGVPWSDLRTGTNLPMNPVFFGLVILIQSLLPATFWTLRLPALVHSLLTIAFAYLLFRHRGKGFAAVIATLLGVLPIQLGYARLAWDPTSVPTVIVLALAAATREKAVLTVLAFGVCLWAHPTTVFAAPILLAPLVVAKWPRAADGKAKLPSRRALVLIGATGICTIVALYVAASAQVFPTAVQAALSSGLPAQMLERLTSLSSALDFARLYAEFVSGPTIYRYVPGSMSSVPAAVHVAGAALVLGVCVLPALRRLPLATRRTDLAVALGLLLSLAGTYVVAGATVLEPHTERYGMFLVVPTCYVLTACIDAWSASPRRAALARVGTAGVGVLLMAAFIAYFLVPLQRADPARHATFRTGEIEPKQAAFSAILARRDPSRVTLISTEDWWIYWPLRYLAGGHPNVQVTIQGAREPGWPFPRDFVPPRRDPAAVENFGVAWAGSKQDEKLAPRALERVDVAGYEPGPILRVYRLQSLSSR